MKQPYIYTRTVKVHVSKNFILPLDVQIAQITHTPTQSGIHERASVRIYNTHLAQFRKPISYVHTKLRNGCMYSEVTNWTSEWIPVTSRDMTCGRHIKGLPPMKKLYWTAKSRQHAGLKFSFPNFLKLLYLRYCFLIQSASQYHFVHHKIYLVSKPRSSFWITICDTTKSATVILKLTVFYNMKSRGPADNYRCFGEDCCVRSQGRKKVVWKKSQTDKKGRILQHWIFFFARIIPLIWRLKQGIPPKR
jgi:hypothetical protein